MNLLARLLSRLRPRRKMRCSESTHRPELEPLEAREVPALIASQVHLAPPLLTAAQVHVLLQRASAATASNDGIIAIVDRNGNILGVRVESGVSQLVTGDPEKLGFAVDGAVAEARTAAFFSSDAAALTSRTVGFLSQSTVTQREVNSDPNITDPNSTLRGPGFVAAIEAGGHFPPGVANTPLADLFDIEATNRDSYISPGPDAIKGTADDISLPSRFNASFAPGDALTPPLSYDEAILPPAGQHTPGVAVTQSRGIGTLPGGIPLYNHGTLVGGIGVFFPGTTGYASAENSSLSADYDPGKPDRTLEAEFVGLAAEGGSSALGLRVGALGGVAPLPGFDLPDGRIDLAGVTLNSIGTSGDLGPYHLVQYAQAHLGVGHGDPATGPGSNTDLPVNFLGTKYLPGTAVPQGWLVAPHAGGNLTAADVTKIVNAGITAAISTRAQIRLPIGDRTRMVFAVSDEQGNVLGHYRMADATYFSIDVAVAKSRNVAYYDNAAQLQPHDQVAGVPAGASLTNRTFRYLADPRFPSGIDGTPSGPFSILNDGGVNPADGLSIGPPLPASAFQSVMGYDAFHPGTNFHAPTPPQNQNGVVFFPGSSGVYKNIGGSTIIVGGFGVSGDGVNQDDFITAQGIVGYGPPPNLRADQYFVRGVRLPYQNFARNPTG